MQHIEKFEITTGKQQIFNLNRNTERIDTVQLNGGLEQQHSFFVE